MLAWFSNQHDSNQAFPTQPRKVRRWLKHLPLTNSGETTRQFFNGLKAANRQDIPAKHRLEIMEAMRPTATIILENLRKHLVARSLPLPSKSAKVMQLRQTLLAEMAMGYKIVMQQVANGEAKLDKKHTAMCIHRALRYLGQRLLQTYQIYGPTPPGVWQDIYQLYLYAEKHALLGRPIKDSDYSEIEKSTIHEAFTQITLLSLAKPATLRQGEAARLSVFFETTSAYVDISDCPAQDSTASTHYMNTNLDAPPQYVIRSDITLSTSNRYMNVSGLIEQLNTKIDDDIPEPKEGASSIPSTLILDLAHRLLKSLATNPKRRFKRVDRQKVVSVVIGIQDIYQAIGDDMENVWREEQKIASPNELTLMLMPKARGFNDSGEYIIPPKIAQQNDTSYAWDMVGKGNIVTDSLLAQKNTPADKNDIPQPQQEEFIPSSWQTWEVMNASAGGYRLLWKEAQNSKAHVGELLALRETDGNEYHWRLGMIRWMQLHDNRGLEVGMKLLAPTALIATVQKNAVRRQDSGDPIKALLLPRVNVISQPPSLIVPADKFNQGDQIYVKLPNRKPMIELTELGEHSASFRQFNYLNISDKDVDTEEKDDTKEEKKQDFDTLWSAL
ncbi:MAG: hypothetical protein ABFS45_06235 [Pseudomonadota bacterium]